MTNTATHTQLESADTRIVLDEIYYTTSGAMKVLGVGRNCIVNSIKDGTLEVFRHPSGNLFSKGALLNWIAKKTVKTRK